jgi:hypothetical protein
MSFHSFADHEDISMSKLNHEEAFPMYDARKSRGRSGLNLNSGDTAVHVSPGRPTVTSSVARQWIAVFASLTAVFCSAHSAGAATVTFTKLAGLTGGSPALTAVYRADLSSVGIDDVLSISIADNSFGLGGAGGQFSGFDLDAIILSDVSVSSAGEAAALAGFAGFDFSPAGTFFTPGSQRAPTDPKLFGTDAGGGHVDNAVATLGTFDANGTTSIPGAFGFVSMGDGGTLSFNLTQPISTAGLFLYVSEVGDNGEVAAGSIEVSDRPVPQSVPEPSSLVVLGIVGTIAGAFRLRRSLVRRRPRD